MERQGSYALGTLIKPVDDNDEYDADIQIVMNPNSQWEPKDYVLAVNRALAGNKTYADKLRLKTRCVTVDYAGDFHLDVVPRVTIGGKHYICNRIDNKFEETDGNGYRDWFNEKNRITGGNLKRVVRLLKHLRDHKNSFTAKSILLTTLAGNTIKGFRRRNRGREHGCRHAGDRPLPDERLPAAASKYAGDQESGAGDGELQPALGPTSVRQFQEEDPGVRAHRKASEG